MPLTTAPRIESRPTISASDPLLDIEETEQKLTFLIKGSSSVFEAEPLREVIDLKIADARAVPAVVFDLTRMMPLYNICGRIFDIALQASLERKAAGLSTVMKMPIDLYENLRRTDNLPEAKDSIQLGTLTIELAERSSLLAPAAIAAADQRRHGVDKVLASYTGKIRALEEETVFVSLFPAGEDAEEITCELHKRQFPDDELAPGQIFRYRVVASESGETHAKITRFQKISIHPEEVRYLYENILPLIPPDEREAR